MRSFRKPLLVVYDHGRIMIKIPPPTPLVPTAIHVTLKPMYRLHVPPDTRLGCKAGMPFCTFSCHHSVASPYIRFDAPLRW